MTDPWYSLDALPPGRVHVRVAYEAWQIEVVRALHPDTRSMRWCEYRDKTIRWFAPDWTPERWQPINASNWSWPGMPATPLPTRVLPRMSSLGQSFRAVDDAEGAETAHGNGLAGGGVQWWRDVTRVKYEPRGQVSQAMAEARIMRALILDRATRLDLTRQRTNAAVLAGLKASILDMLEHPPEDDWIPRLDAMPQDHADYQTAMGWLVELDPSWRQMTVLLRRMVSPPYRWVEIAEEIGRKPDVARETFERTVRDIRTVANRAPTRAAALIAELQERNRAYKRAG